MWIDEHPYLWGFIGAFIVCLICADIIYMLFRLMVDLIHLGDKEDAHSTKESAETQPGQLAGNHELLPSDITREPSK